MIVRDLHDQFDRLLDGALADELSAKERREFEALLEAHPDLRAAYEQHQAIHASLRTHHAPPAHCGSAQAHSTLSTAHRGPMQIWVRRLAIAAVLLIGVFGAWNAYQYLKPGPAPYPDTGPRRTFEVAYHEIIDAGYEPAWVCKDDQEFRENMARSLRTELLIAQRDPEVRVLGLAYANTISPWTVMILAYVENKPVVVFADFLTSDRTMPEPTTPGLTWYKREISNLVLYELSPLDEARVLPLVYEPADEAPNPEA